MANTTINTAITIYNEKFIFGKKLDENELLAKNDIKYHKRTLVSFLMKHERFSHFKKTLNKSEANYVDSPRGFINFNKNEFQILVLNHNDKIENNENNNENEIENINKNNENNNENKIENINKNNNNNNNNNNTSEIGEAFEYFLTDGKRELIGNLYYYRGDSFNFETLFKIDLMLQSKNKNLIDILNKVPKNKIKDKEYINIQKNYLDNNINRKYKKSDQLYSYNQRKIRIINENTFRKFTFPKNTISKCKINTKTLKFVINK